MRPESPDVIWPWDFCCIFIQKYGFRVEDVAKTKVRQTLRFVAPPQESFALSLHAKHAGTAKRSYCMCFAMQRKGSTRLARQARWRILSAAHIPPRARLGRNMQGPPAWENNGKATNVDRRDPKMRFPAA